SSSTISTVSLMFHLPAMLHARRCAIQEPSDRIRPSGVPPEKIERIPQQSRHRDRPRNQIQPVCARPLFLLLDTKSMQTISCEINSKTSLNHTGAVNFILAFRPHDQN